MKRSSLYQRSADGDVAYFERCRRDMAEVKRRGWTAIGFTTICEPEVPSGVPPVGHPRRALSESLQPGGGAIPLPDYEMGDDGGYSAVPTPDGQDA